MEKQESMKAGAQGSRIISNQETQDKGNRRVIKKVEKCESRRIIRRLQRQDSMKVEEWSIGKQRRGRVIRGLEKQKSGKVGR